MKRIFTLFLVLLPLSAAATSDFDNCFAVIAGKNATVDGSVLMAHNEDDPGELMVSMYACPKYLWEELPGWDVADTFFNQYGVAIISDKSSSREDAGEIRDGGVLRDVRVTVGERARTAREGVKIIGELMDKYGYLDSGRTYMISDANEGWVVEVMKGRHWVAQRVPDDEVYIIPNYYVIDKVDLSDTVNFAGSPDIVEYAISRGWYNPETDGEFSFRKVYSKPSTRTNPRNLVRHALAIEYVCGEKPSDNPDERPFSIKANKKISVQDLMNILSIRLEGLNDQGSICRKTTVLSNIFQFRGGLPKEVGCVMWTAMGHPCIEAFIPWYLGMNEAPAGWGRCNTIDEAQATHFKYDKREMRPVYPDLNWWKYWDRWQQSKDDIENVISAREKPLGRYQKKLFRRQARFEKKMLRKFFKDGVVSDPDGLSNALVRRLESDYRRYDKI